MKNEVFDIWQCRTASYLLQRYKSLDVWQVKTASFHKWGMESRRLPGGVAVDELHDQRHVVVQHLVGGRGVSPGKVEGVGVVLEKE